MMKTCHSILAGLCLATIAGCGGSSSGKSNPPDAPTPPNILFIVIDDVGVDQFDFYGYGGAVPPQTPNLQTIADEGLKFRNAWAMPTCTPTRATYFTGRYPSSTNILNAVVQTDLANSEISPYEMTLPKLLKTAGYTSAMIGKMHLTGTNLGTSANLPYGLQTMWKLGFDHFDGYLDGAPYPIDTRAGLKTWGDDVAEGPYQCGFVPRASFENGADSGACYFVDNTCTDLSVSEPDDTAPGRTCMEQGGIFDPGQICQATTPEHIDFEAQNGYYTGKFVWSDADGNAGEVLATDASARGYRSTLETDRAIEWVNAQSGDKPWMLSLGYSAVHAPLQLPPKALIAEDTPGRNDPLVCSPASSEIEGVPGAITSMVDDRLITNLMLEAMDKEIGRLLVETGLATRAEDGTLAYNPDSNTVVVITGDNGTYVNSVKITAPGQFDMTRAKGSPYQTGVNVPLLVAGAIVSEPGREVPYQVSSPDLYRLFADIAGAGIDAHISAQRPLDGQPMLAYLTDPAAEAVREINFSEMGTNFVNPEAGIVPQPCVVEAADTCFVIFPNKALCDDQSGVWYGEGSGLPGVPEDGFAHCGQVMSYLQALNPADATKVLPDSSKAASDGTYKLVRMNRRTYTEDLENPVNSAYTGVNTNMDEFYQINMLATPNPVIDREGDELLIGEAPLDISDPVGFGQLDTEAQAAYIQLKQEMDKRDAVAAYNYNYDTDDINGCPGDGNRDFKVDETDLANWEELSELNRHPTEHYAQSTWYDFNHDGKTDENDRYIIEANLGRICTPPEA
ncbi:lipoprotein [Isoalcanivorax pacificus W11-5]|uniref:Lipoprotein n=1 Tax=Isoalcanivorax pacificus W11-5 TaxID=391936 RepID=A0A0B4XM71_9GAMM|nr:sulfatase-like hydrolase/transferase [Isoalcanivorax pacificus]AJD47432.1 lipoprotein [Isoalcanivorax pacificus W11-5]